MNPAKILAVVTIYPSPAHPYIIRLFAALKKQYPGLRLFLFRPGDRTAGEAQIGKEQVDMMLSDAYMRGQPKLKPQVLTRFLSKAIKAPGRAAKAFKRARSKGLSTLQSAGQVFYHQEILSEKFDLVYFNAVQIAYHFDIPHYFPNTPVLMSSRGQDFDIYPDKYNETLTYADHVHVLGDYLKKQVAARGIDIEDITVIPPAFLKKWSGRKDSSYKNPTLTISIASRLTWLKGIRYLIEAVAHLKEMLPGTPVELHIMGSGEAEEELRYRVNMLKLEKEVTFHGWTDEGEVIKTVRESFVYCLPSLLEGFNNSVVTAQSLGIPCVVSNAGGLPENVLHEKTGLVVPPYDSRAIALAIIKLWQDRELYQSFSNQAVERVKDLDFEIHLQKYIEMFDKMLAKPKES
ncbi:MAG: glycosyltransferase [Cyclobacteriaceae bacterium]